MNLKAEIVKLAHDKPELRKHLIPLLREAAGGPDPKGRNWKLRRVSGIPHWVWHGSVGDTIKTMMVIEGDFSNASDPYWMTVKMQDGSFFSSKRTEDQNALFKLGTEIYSKGLDPSRLPGWKSLNRK